MLCHLEKHVSLLGIRVYTMYTHRPDVIHGCGVCTKWKTIWKRMRCRTTQTLSSAASSFLYCFPSRHSHWVFTIQEIIMRYSFLHLSLSFPMYKRMHLVITLMPFDWHRLHFASDYIDIGWVDGRTYVEKSLSQGPKSYSRALGKFQ